MTKNIGDVIEFVELLHLEGARMGNPVWLRTYWKIGRIPDGIWIFYRGSLRFCNREDGRRG